MITLKPTVPSPAPTAAVRPFTGPYRRRPSLMDYAVNITGLAAIGVLLAVSVLGMSGAFERQDQPMTLACVTCAGGVGK